MGGSAGGDPSGGTTAPAPAGGLADDDFPEVYLTAGATATHMQRWFLRSSAVQLVLLIAAAGLAGYASPPTLGAAAVAFTTAAILKGHLLARRFDRNWYEARAVAETAKSFAWRFAVGGDPFPIGMPEEEAGPTLRRVLAERSSSAHVALVPPEAQHGQVTAGMIELRRRPLEQRREIYRRDRVEDQRRWYARKAVADQRLADRWGWAMLAFELLGAAAVVVKAAITGKAALHLPWSYSVGGVAAAAAGAAAAWLQTRQHQSLASSYASTARQLQALEDAIVEASTEERWAAYVAGCEDSMATEQSLWRAARGV